MKNRKIRQINSKSSVNTQGSKKKQKNMDDFSFKPSRSFVQNGDVAIKKTVLPVVSSEGAGKALLVEIKKKLLLQTLRYCKSKYSESLGKPGKQIADI